MHCKFRTFRTEPVVFKTKFQGWDDVLSVDFTKRGKVPATLCTVSLSLFTCLLPTYVLYTLASTYLFVVNVLCTYISIMF